MEKRIKYEFDEKIAGIRNLILDDYNGDSIMDRMDTFNQPDQEVIIDLLYKLMRIIYPGHYRRGTRKTHSTVNSLSALIEECAFNLKNQIAIVLPDQVAGDTEEARERKAQELTCSFFERIPAIRSHIKTDLVAAYDGDPAAYSLDEIIIAYPGLFTITTNRIAHELYLMKIPLIPRMLTEYAHGKTGIDIHPGATIGDYFFIDHGTGIVIGETTVIGSHVKIYQGVTLGALSTRGGQSLRGKRRHPTIEDSVTIYAGASILGGDTTIGAGSVIGSNVFITSSVAPGTRISVKNQELDIRGKEVKHEGDFLQGDFAQTENKQ